VHGVRRPGSTCLGWGAGAAHEPWVSGGRRAFPAGRRCVPLKRPRGRPAPQTTGSPASEWGAGPGGRADRFRLRPAGQPGPAPGGARRGTQRPQSPGFRPPPIRPDNERSDSRPQNGGGRKDVQAPWKQSQGNRNEADDERGRRSASRTGRPGGGLRAAPPDGAEGGAEPGSSPTHKLAATPRAGATRLTRIATDPWDQELSWSS